MSDPSAIEALARKIAEEAHDGQVDKLGEPYIDHVRRVAERLNGPLDRAVAWLHDVVEDTDWESHLLHERAGELGVARNVMTDAWFDVVEAVDALTHRSNEPRSDYYARIRISPRAVRVKLADVADNSDPERLAGLDEATRERLTAKYAKARAALEAP